jgi:hypothetical protein
MVLDGWLVGLCLFVFGSLVIAAFVSHDGWSWTMTVLFISLRNSFHYTHIV